MGIVVDSMVAGAVDEVYANTYLKQAIPGIPLRPVIHQCLDDLPFALRAMLG